MIGNQAKVVFLQKHTLPYDGSDRFSTSNIGTQIDSDREKKAAYNNYMVNMGWTKAAFSKYLALSSPIGKTPVLSPMPNMPLYC
jgi:hypothetical protein